VNGRLVRTLVDREDTPGEKSIDWDGKDDRGMAVSSGVYFYRIVTPGLAETRKMAFIQ
jgi:flagellar hook assembly protein FlgD